MKRTNHDPTKWLIHAFILAMLILMPNFVAADGKFFYHQDQIPSDIPFQRAIILHDGQEEIIFVQSKWNHTSEELSWIVPVPALPKIAFVWDIDYHYTWSGFISYLTGNTVPYITDITSIVFLTILFIFVIVILASYIVPISYGKNIIPLPRAWMPFVYVCLLIVIVLNLNSSSNMRGGVPSPIMNDFVLFAVWFVAAAIFFLFILNSVIKEWHTLAVNVFAILLIILVLASVTLGGVRIHSEQQIGPYDIKVVSSEDALGIIGWLKEHGFHFTEKDRDVFKWYTEKNWYFVTARIRPDTTEQRGVVDHQGMVNPLVLSFPSKEIVYPLRLTGITKTPVEMILYVLANHKVTTDERLKLVFASGDDELLAGVNGIIKKRLVLIDTYPDNDTSKDELWKRGTDLRKLLRISDMNPSYLTRFHGTLSPENMQTDLIFVKAADNSPSRVTIYK